MAFGDLIRRILWARQAGTALGFAKSRGLPGTAFAGYSRSSGWKLLLGGAPWGLHWLSNPVSSVRYFEFDFAWRHLKGLEGPAADLASPRLFSLFWAAQGRGPVDMINPDGADLERSREAAGRLGLPGLAFEKTAAEALAGRPGRYSALWSLSVVEHIDGDYDDSQALAWAWAALRPGGRLLITVPVAREFRVEKRPGNAYGLQQVSPDGLYFFQRHYDEAALKSRIINAVGKQPSALEFYGERVAGTFDAYEKRWMEKGDAETVQDPRFMAENFLTFPNWASMPGMGVAGLLFIKD